MYIGFELDNLISTPLKNITDIESVEKQKLIDGVKEVLNEIKSQGHGIILYTKRDSCTKLETEAWLDKNKIPYDQIIFDRPHHLVLYFSDDCRQFVNWKGVKEELIKYGFLLNKKKDEISKTIKTDVPENNSSGSIQNLKHE